MRKLNMARRNFWLMSLLAALVMGAIEKGIGAEGTDDDPLLDLFVQKGFVTQEEAEKVKAEADRLRTNGAANAPEMNSKWTINNGINKVQLFGDVRVRYEDRSADDSAGGNIDLQRFRYAVRVGLRGEAFDDFYYGVRLDTAANPRSSWLTMGSSTSGTYQGPFGKSTAGIDIGQAYLGWRPWGWLDLTVGKMPNPLYTTPLVWDPDLNPEGAAEHLKFTVGGADLFVNFGQFLYADFNPNTASSGFGVNSLSLPSVGAGQTTDNIFMFAWQAGLNYHFTTNMSAKVAATLYNYTGLQRSSPLNQTALAPYFGDPYVGEGAYYYYGANNAPYALGDSGYNPGHDFVLANGEGYGSVSFPFNQVGVNNLLVVEVPFEFDFKIKKLDAQVFGDAAYNLEGAQRARDAAAAYSAILSANTPANGGNAIPRSFPAQTHDVKAYQIGFDIGSRGGLGLLNGSVSKKNAWELRTYWQHIEQYSLDPNLIDSDVFEGRENLQGIYVALAYGLSDNVVGAVRYAHAMRINDQLGTGGSNQDMPWINPINDFDLFQVDLTFRF